MTSNFLQAIRARYGFRKYTVTNEDEWNALARLFVQRFQELSQIPTDSLAGPATFAILELTLKRQTEKRRRCQSKPYGSGPLPQCEQEEGHFGLHRSSNEVWE